MNLLFLVILVAVYFIASAIFMALWNSVVMKSFKTGTINKINYTTALGMTLFVSIFFGGTVVANGVAHPAYQQLA